VPSALPEQQPAGIITVRTTGRDEWMLWDMGYRQQGWPA
jgi:hypothetical protein